MTSLHVCVIIPIIKTIKFCEAYIPYCMDLWKGPQKDWVLYPYQSEKWAPYLDPRANSQGKCEEIHTSKMYTDLLSQEIYILEQIIQKRFNEKTIEKIVGIWSVVEELRK